MQAKRHLLIKRQGNEKMNVAQARKYLATKPAVAEAQTVLTTQAHTVVAFTTIHVYVAALAKAAAKQPVDPVFADMKVVGDIRPVSVATVNAAIKAAGGAERLTHGRGYYYFRDGDATAWPSTSVYVSHVDALTVAEWLNEWRTLKAAV